MISKSYPYLSIAKKYGLDYGLVLRAAAFLSGKYRYMEIPLTEEDTQMFSKESIEDITDASTYFRDVQDGRVTFPST